MRAPSQVKVRDSALRTPTSANFLRSEGLASHVRGWALAWEKNIATATTESVQQNLRPLQPDTDALQTTGQVNRASDK